MSTLLWELEQMLQAFFFGRVFLLGFLLVDTDLFFCIEYLNLTSWDNNNSQ